MREITDYGRKLSCNPDRVFWKVGYYPRQGFDVEPLNYGWASSVADADAKIEWAIDHAHLGDDVYGRVP